MAFSAGNESGGPMAEINVTPLVDVMLVLLIIFMVTAPMLNTGVDLELPQANAAPLPDDSEGKLILNIDKKGAVFLGDAPVPWKELETKLATNAKVQADHTLYISADKNIPYGVVLQVMAVAQKAGVTRLMMMADPMDVGEPPEEPTP